MMDHTQYRTALLADPHDPSPELRAHHESCAECQAFTAQLLGFESSLARALRIDIGAADAVAPRKAAPRRVGGMRWMALAASVLLGAALVVGIWVAVPSSSLAAAVVAHMAGEPDAWQTIDPVPAVDLNGVLEKSQVKLMPQAGRVSYATTPGGADEGSEYRCRHGGAHCGAGAPVAGLGTLS
jgi:hypothetical protein